MRLGLRALIEANVISLLAGRWAERRACDEGLAAPRVSEPEPTAASDRDTQRRRRKLEQLALERAARAAGEVNLADDDQVASLIERVTFGPDEAAAYLAWLRERTRGLIEQPTFWRATCALASALLERETLDGGACRRIIREALSPKPADPVVAASAIARARSAAYASSNGHEKEARDACVEEVEAAG
jgi:hypothetical protein